MKLARIACAAAAMLLLAGCSSRQSIEELLRAPQPNEAQSAVQTALSNFLGEPLQLKYPRGGSEMAPLLFLDLDGDGDAVYTAYNGIKNVPSIETTTAADATVYCKNAGIATVVYIDASGTDAKINTSTNNVVYVNYDPDVTAVNDSVKGVYYTFEAVVNNEITTIDVDATTYNDIKNGQHMFDTITKDSHDVYSLSNASIEKKTGIEKVANDVLGFGTGSNSQTYAAYVAADNCQVYYVDDNGVLTQISVPTVVDDKTDVVYYKLNSNNELTTVVIEQDVNNQYEMTAIDFELSDGTKVSARAVNTTTATAVVLSTPLANDRVGQTVTLTGVTVPDGATYSINGSDTATVLAYGGSVTDANRIKVTVTAENGDQKDYTIQFVAEA